MTEVDIFHVSQQLGIKTEEFILAMTTAKWHSCKHLQDGA